jgi:hypothetical protein
MVCSLEMAEPPARAKGENFRAAFNAGEALRNALGAAAGGFSVLQETAVTLKSRAIGSLMGIL